MSGVSHAKTARKELRQLEIDAHDECARLQENAIESVTELIDCLAEPDEADNAQRKPSDSTSEDDVRDENRHSEPDRDDEEWTDALDEAYEKAEIARSSGTITTKTINGRDYYYLQWRDGEKVKSQYVAPVDPA